MATRKNPEGSSNVKSLPDNDNQMMIGIEAYTQGVEINDVNADRTGGLPILGRSVSGNHKLITVTKSGNEVRLVEPRGSYNNAFVEDVRCDFKSRSIFNVASVTFTMDSAVSAPASGSFSAVTPTTSSITNPNVHSSIASTAEIHFSGSYAERPSSNIIVSLTSTDGTTLHYSGTAGSTSAASRLFDVDSTGLADDASAGVGYQQYAINQLVSVVENATHGHGSRFILSKDPSGTRLLLTQSVPGYSGNTTVRIQRDTNVYATSFSGGLDNTIFVATSSYGTNATGDYFGRGVIATEDGRLSKFPERQVTKWYMDFAISGNAWISGSNSDIQSIQNDDSDPTDGRDFNVHYKPTIKSVTFGDRGVQLPRSAPHDVFVKQIPNPETFVPVTGYQSQHDDSEVYVDRASFMTSSKVDIVEYMKKGDGEIMNHPSYKHSYASSGIVEIAHRREMLYGDWTYLFSQRWPQANWIGYAQNEQQVDVYENTFDVRERNYAANAFEDRGTPYTHDSRTGIVGDFPLISWNGYLMRKDLLGDQTTDPAKATIQFLGDYFQRPDGHEGGVSGGKFHITDAEGTKIVYSASNVSRYELQTAADNVTNANPAVVTATAHGLQDGCLIYVTSSLAGGTNTDAVAVDRLPAGRYFVRDKATDTFQLQPYLSSSATRVSLSAESQARQIYWSAPVFDVLNPSDASVAQFGDQLMVDTNFDGTVDTTYNPKSEYTYTYTSNNITNADPAVVTSAAHGLLDGQIVYIDNKQKPNGDDLSDKPVSFTPGLYFVRDKTDNTFELQELSGSSSDRLSLAHESQARTISHAKESNTIASPFVQTFSVYQKRAATHLSGAIDSLSGHNGKISVTFVPDSSNTKLLLSQSVSGISGNNTITYETFTTSQVESVGFLSGTNPFTLSKAEKFLDEEYYVPEDNLTIEPFIDRKFQDLLFIEPDIADVLTNPPALPYDPMKRNITGSLNNDDDWVLGVVDMRTGFDDYAGQRKDSWLYRDLKR